MYGLIPLPAAIKAGSGVCSLNGSPVLSGCEQLPAERRVLESWLDMALASSSPGADRPGTAKPGTPLLLTLSGEPPHSGAEGEAYILEIEAASISIAAQTPAGLVRAGATLAQLMLSHGLELPCLRIEDSPRFAWRGFMLDTVRNYFRVEFIERLLDIAALHKLNVFHWHLTDDQAWRPDIPGMPELAAIGSRRVDRRVNIARWKEGCYSASDIARIVAYAAARHIMVVPEIDVPGHSSALLASHPELWCRSSFDAKRFEPVDSYGIFDAVLCAGRDSTFDTLHRIFSGLAALFPAGYIHAGGDEVPKEQWLVCEHCRARMKEQRLFDEHGQPDPEALQAWFMGQVKEDISRLGRTMVGWDELVDGGCSKDVLIMAWRSAGHGYRAAAKGYKVVMCSQEKACYLDHKHLDVEEEPGQLGTCTVADAYSFDPAPPDLDGETRANIIGGQANLWSELVYFGRQAEYMLFPRLCALSESFWSPQARRNFGDFRLRLETHGCRLDKLGVNRYRGPLEAAIL